MFKSNYIYSGHGIISFCPTYIKSGFFILLAFMIALTVVLNLFAILDKVSPFSTIYSVGQVGDGAGEGLGEPPNCLIHDFARS